MKTLIGYLIGVNGRFRVDCEGCAQDKTVKVHKEDIGNFKQTCKTCKKILVDNIGPELFDGIR